MCSIPMGNDVRRVFFGDCNAAVGFWICQLRHIKYLSYSNKLRQQSSINNLDQIAIVSRDGKRFHEGYALALALSQ